MSTLSMRGPRLNWSRGLVVTLACAAIFVPLLLIFYQSFLSAPFFSPSKTLGLDAYRFIFEDPDFGLAFKNGMIMAAGLTAIAVPLGGMLAFLMVRTDLPGRNWIAPLLLVPIFVSPMVVAFGYCFTRTHDEPSFLGQEPGSRSGRPLSIRGCRWIAWNFCRR